MAAQRWDGASPVTYGLLGRTLGHSWSPLIHEKLGTTPYTLIELEPDELAGFVARDDWRGLNVTMPYKVEAARLADELTEAARHMGAVNTLWRRSDGTILGDNTDVFGFSWLLERFCESNLDGIEALEGAEVLVLGSGGASKAVVYALEQVGAEPHVISRSGEDNYENLLERHGEASLIVNTTPVGMFPRCPDSPLSRGVLSQMGELEGVLDIVYNPERTGIVLEAMSLGLPAEGGLGMLVGQAWRSSEIWQQAELDRALIGQIEGEIRAQTRNVVLIGMPGSGKSSCGRRLEEITGRGHVDLDDAFADAYGRSAAQVIEQDGEDAFRTMETDVLAAYSAQSSLILSCGGGVVTRPENLPLMQQNGTIVMLDRPLEQLSSKGRPISKATGVEALAEQRMPLYRAWADEVVTCTGSARGDALEIVERLGL